MLLPHTTQHIRESMVLKNFELFIEGKLKYRYNVFIQVIDGYIASANIPARSAFNQCQYTSQINITTINIVARAFMQTKSI